MRFDLNEGFPLLTLKRIHWKSVVHELLWFISGNTNVKYLNDNGVRIWNEWSGKDGELGAIYGKQWRNFGGVDQIANILDSIRNNPNSRRHIVSAWNVGELNQMALPPCHAFFQFYVADNKLSCQLYQRSVDVFLGLPFNIASYALLTHMIAQETGLEVGEFIHTSGDAHIYSNHNLQCQIMLNRHSLPLPSISIDKIPFFDVKFNNIHLHNYQSHGTLKGAVAV